MQFRNSRDRNKGRFPIMKSSDNYNELYGLPEQWLTTL